MLTAIVTPFKRDGAVDLDSFRALARHLVDNGSDGLVVTGTTGEGPVLSDEERLELYAAALDEVGDRATVVAGTGTYDTRHSIHLTEKAHELGVDAFLIVTPYYSKPPQRGIVAHFEAVAAATDRPVVVYNIPSRVVINIEPETIIRLAEIDNVRAVKQAYDDLAEARHIVETGLDLYAGDDDLILPFLELGGIGGICVHTHVVGPQVKELVRLWKAGEHEAARDLDRQLRPSIELLRVVGNPIAIKAALNLLGHEVGGHRLPLVEASHDERDRDSRLPLPARPAPARRRLGTDRRAYTPRVSLRIIPLGGLGEVGKNMTVYEHGDEIVVVDAGLAFPRDEHLGVDLVLPDIGYLRDRRVNAVVLTHGHEDHVGGLPYLLREVDCDKVIATKLTLGLIKSKLDEHGLTASTQLEEAETGKKIQIGSFTLDFVRVAHSIPDCVAVVLETAAGRVVHTGDWKLDHTPVDGLKTDVGRLAELGNLGVDLMLGDSTNAERPGMTGSERLVGEAFRTLIPLRKGRILVVSFASNVHRMQQAIDVAIQVGRKVAIVGRSMRKNLNIARQLGYLDVPEHILIKPQEAMELPPGQVMILCTGSQGEPMSALTRIAYNDHPSVSIERGDTVILSAKPVPGNELRVHDSINRLAKAGAEVLHQEIAPVHVSGHACSEEMRTMLSLLRPRAVMPVHGEYRMLAAHGQLSLESGVPAEAIIIAENGSVVELEPGRTPRIIDRIEAGVTFVDGLGVGDVRDVALRDRRRLSEDGVLIIVTTLASTNGGSTAPPELIARGFGDSEDLIDELRDEAARVLEDMAADDITEIKLLQEHLHDAVGQLIYDRTRRRPMILPVVIEV